MIHLEVKTYVVRNEHGIALGTIERDYRDKFTAKPYTGKARYGLTVRQATEYIAPGQAAHNCNYGSSTLGYFAHCMTDDCDFDSDGIPTLSDAKDIAERHNAREI